MRFVAPTFADLIVAQMADRIINCRPLDRGLLFFSNFRPGLDRFLGFLAIANSHVFIAPKKKKMQLKMNLHNLLKLIGIYTKQLFFYVLHTFVWISFTMQSIVPKFLVIQRENASKCVYVWY